MAFYKMQLNENLVAFANDVGNLCKMSCQQDKAHLLFVDRSAELLAFAEDAALSCGCKNIYFDYAARYSEFGEFLEAQGYGITDKKRLLTVKISELFESKGVKKSINIEFPGMEFIPIRDLMIYQMDELYELFETASIPLNKEDIVRFDEDLSGIVYNQDMNIASFILSYIQGEEIIIECLYGTKKGDPRYIMAALQGFAREMITLRLLNMYRNITVIEANATVGPLLRRLLDGKYEVMDDGTVKRAEKILKKVPKNNLPDIIDADRIKAFEIDKALEEKLRFQYCQNNINWKMGWSI